jgi:hypothetical protein
VVASEELVDRLPAGCRLTPEALFLPDATQIGFGAVPPDQQLLNLPIMNRASRQPFFVMWVDNAELMQSAK